METKGLTKIILGGVAGLAVILGAASCVPTYRRPYTPPMPYMQPRHIPPPSYRRPYAPPPQHIVPPSRRGQYMPQRPMPPRPHR